MRRSGPPKLARFLFARLLSGARAPEALSDLDDIWLETHSREGRGRADRWYWGQLLRTLVPALAGSAVGTPASEGWLGAIRRDVHFALGQLRRHPGVGLVVVATLSLGIGVTTAMFSAVHAVLLTPLPYEQPDELVVLTSESGGSSLPRYLSGPDLVDMAEGVPGVEALAFFGEATVGPLTDVERPEHIVTTPVSWNLFSMLGVEPVLGRTFRSVDAVPRDWSSDPLPTVPAVISFDFWQSSFGGDPDIIGRTVRVWGGPTEVVGVLPEAFRLHMPPSLNIPPAGDIWRVMDDDLADQSREGRWYRTVARLAPSVGVPELEAQLDRFAESLRAVHPHHASEETRFRAASVAGEVAAPLRTTLWVLLAAVFAVLLIACANVANLLTTRGAGRAQEMAVRTSLGAGSDRLVRQLLTESAVLAVAGALGGVLLARLGVTLLHAIRPPELHRLEAVGLDLPVLLFALAATFAVTLLAGLVPALQTARVAPAGALRRRGVGVGRRSRRALVVAEVALSVGLIAGAGLLIRTFGELQRMPLGFEPERVLTVTATQSGRPSEERQAYEAELLRAAAAVPGVESAGIVFPLPMNGVYERSAEYAPAESASDPQGWSPAYFRTISPDYFRTMGLQLRRGRSFETTDENPDEPTVVIDEVLAARDFGGVDPLGRRLHVRGMTGDTLIAQIVGVVEHAPQWDHRDTRATMYFPRTFYRSHEVSVVAKVTDDPTRVSGALAAAIRATDPRFPSDLVPMESYVRDRLTRSRFLLVLMQLFAGLALILSAVGLYGVLSYSVRTRTREMGMRLALGARASALTGRIVREGLALGLVGIAVGLVGALFMGRALSSQLFRVGFADPWALSGAAAAVLAVTALASLVPALRASRVDPVVALKSD